MGVYVRMYVCGWVSVCARVCFMTELLRYYSQLRFLVVL